MREIWESLRDLGRPIHKWEIAQMTGYKTGESALISMEYNDLLFFENPDGTVEPFIR